jgi:hypothetical protein
METDDPGRPQVPQSMRSRTLSELKMSEATEYVEKCLQVCISHGTGAKHWLPQHHWGSQALAPPTLLGELKPSPQEPCESWYPNNEGAWKAICWG